MPSFPISELIPSNGNAPMMTAWNPPHGSSAGIDSDQQPVEDQTPLSSHDIMRLLLTIQLLDGHYPSFYIRSRYRQN